MLSTVRRAHAAASGSSSSSSRCLPPRRPRALGGDGLVRERRPHFGAELLILASVASSWRSFSASIPIATERASRSTRSRAVQVTGQAHHLQQRRGQRIGRARRRYSRGGVHRLARDGRRTPCGLDPPGARADAGVRPRPAPAWWSSPIKRSRSDRLTQIRRASTELHARQVTLNNQVAKRRGTGGRTPPRRPGNVTSADRRVSQSSFSPYASASSYGGQCIRSMALRMCGKYHRQRSSGQSR